MDAHETPRHHRRREYIDSRAVELTISNEIVSIMTESRILMQPFLFLIPSPQ